MCIDSGECPLACDHSIVEVALCPVSVRSCVINVIEQCNSVCVLLLVSVRMCVLIAIWHCRSVCIVSGERPCMINVIEQCNSVCVLFRNVFVVLYS